MRKLFTYLFVVALLAIGNYGVLQAQDTYKKYHIHEDFSGNALPSKPSAWTINNTNSSSQTSNVYGGAGAATWAEEMLTISGSGGGNRGMEIFFPTPQSNPEMNGYDVIYMEFDWTINKASVTDRASLGLVFMDKDRTKDTPLPIFGIYLAGTDGFFHYWNMDTEGPETSTSGTYYGPVYTTGNGGGGFRRQGNSADETNAINQSTRTSVAYTVGSTYHVTAALNFTTKQVVSLTIADVDNPANTGTITDQAFIDTNADDLGVLAAVNTRGGNVGNNGANIDFAVYFDNFDIYVNAISLGRRDVTVNYLDQDGQAAKAARVIPQQEVGLTYSALLSDMASFVEGGNYYAYNAAATVSDQVTVDLEGANAINLIFKKSPALSGTYTWTGTTSSYWDELDNNFSVNGGADVSYQNGNSIAFSNASVANKEIIVQGNVLLGDANVTVSADGYAFSGDGKLVGDGNMVLNPGSAGTVVMGLDNALNVTVESGSVHVKHATSASKYIVPDNTDFLLELAAGNFATPVEGQGGQLNFSVLAESYNSPAITNVSGVNILLSNPGRLKSTDWTTKWTTIFPENTVVNVSNVPDTTIVGFGAGNNALKDATVNLGDNVRLVRDYNEAAAGTDTLRIGALNGTALSYVESGWVDGRKSSYMVGGLNTDADFAGTLRSFVKNDTAVFTSRTSTSRMFLYKVGTGKQTLSGNSPEYSGNIVARGGTLAITGSLIAANDTVTVESGATLDVSGSFGILDANVNGTFELSGDATLRDVNVNGTFRNKGTISGARDMFVKAGGVFEGGIDLGNTFDLTGATVKLNVEDTHIDGAYDVITVAGDALIYEGNTLSITVAKATKGDKIKLLDCANIGGEFEQVLINGVAIAEKPFIWHGETGELEATDDMVGITDIVNVKDIQSVRYYNLTGMQVTKNTTGFVIKKITYTDGSVETVKSFVKEK
jgi:hypothetical protein